MLDEDFYREDDEYKASDGLNRETELTADNAADEAADEGEDEGG